MKTKSENQTYTFLFEFKGGTYLRQVVADSKESALSIWSEKIGEESLVGANEYFRSDLLEGVEDVVLKHGFTRVNGLRNVWCCTFHFRKSSVGILTITITDVRNHETVS